MDSLKTKRSNPALDPTALAFADSMLIYTGSISMVELRQDVKRLYDSEDATSKQSALWLMRISGDFKTDILDAALKYENPKIRSMSLAILSGNYKFDRYEDSPLLKDYSDSIQRIAVADKDPEVSAMAVRILGRNKKSGLSKNIIKNILSDGIDERRLLQLLKAMQNGPMQEYADCMDLVLPFLKHESSDVRAAACAVVSRHAQEDDIPSYIGDMADLDDFTKQAVIKRLAPMRINSNQIARWLASNAADQKTTMDLLLYNLAAQDKVSEVYTETLGSVIESKTYDEQERSYAIYILGKMKGYDYLHKKYGITLNKNNTTAENTAIFLSYPGTGKTDTKNLLNIEDGSVLAVGALEVSRLIDSNSFGKHFLLLCRERLENWRSATQHSQAE